MPTAGFQRSARCLPLKASSTLTLKDRCMAVWSSIASSHHKFDLLIICEDGSRVRCHQAVLASASQRIGELLEGKGVMTMDGSWRTEEVTILMPDVQSRDLVRVLGVLYNGYTTVTVRAAEELKKVWKHLGIDIVGLNNKEKIEVVNIENMKGMGVNIHFSENVKEDVAKVEQLNSSLEETVNITPVRARKYEDADQSTYFTPCNMSTLNTSNNLTSPSTSCHKSFSNTPNETKASAFNTSMNYKNQIDLGTNNTSTLPIKWTSNIPVIKSTINTQVNKTISNKHDSPSMNGMEDPSTDPDDPPYISEDAPRGKKRKEAPNASALPVIKPASCIPLPTRALSSNLSKKTKIECGSGSYYVEEIHTCLVCNGKTPDGRVDKEASNLSFREIKRLREHYSRHLYSEGKIFKHAPAEPENVDADGKVIDEFGSKYKYNCEVKNCWKSKKPACGYKEMALHNAAEHGVLEKVLAADERPALKRLLEQIQEAKEKERLATQPLSCLIPECPESDVLYTNHGDYQSLKGHYSSQHWGAWFMAPTEPNKPRTQKVKEPRRGTLCDICQVKVFGDENSMREHYAVVHDQLVTGIMDVEHSGVGLEESRAVLVQLYPHRLKEFEKKLKNGERLHVEGS